LKVAVPEKVARGARVFGKAVAMPASARRSVWESMLKNMEYFD